MSESVIQDKFEYRSTKAGSFKNNSKNKKRTNYEDIKTKIE